MLDVRRDRPKITNPLLRFMGLSSDYRTNRWQVRCPKCGTWMEPATTMYAQQSLQCEKRKCNIDIFVDYNSEIVREVETDE